MGGEWRLLDSTLGVSSHVQYSWQQIVQYADDKVFAVSIVAGAALALKNWCWQFIHPDNPALPSVQNFTNGHGYYENVGELIQQLKTDMHHPNVIGHTPPRVLVLGAKGRCGRGAVDLLKKVGVTEENIVQWDIEETKDRNGPYPEIIYSDIFINTVRYHLIVNSVQRANEKH